MPSRRYLAFLSTILAPAAILGCDGSDPAPTSTSTSSSGQGGEGVSSSSSSSSANSSASSSSSTGSGGMGGEGGMGGAPPACLTDSDCASSSVGSICNVDTGACVECLGDTQCPSGNICITHVCEPGCSAEQPCENGLACCDSVCRDVSSDNDHCGSCNQACESTVTADRACTAGVCAITSCQPYFYDCNANPSDGCEQSDNKNPCVCAPGSATSCYLGAPGTQGVGPCAAGLRTCDADGLGWSECQGQVLPQWEICANQIDDDCNGLVDENVDNDGDGWGTCDGDCADIKAQGEFNVPAYRINPGALEILSNGVDDDCDPTTLDTMAAPDCSMAEKLTEVSAADLVKAMDFCQFTQENLPLPERKWGVIDAEFLLADGSVPSAAQLNDIRNAQTAVLEHYGDLNDPRRGKTMAGLSTGMMRDTVHHGYAGSTSFTSVVNPPANYLAEVGGQLPHPPNCPGATVAKDSVNLRFRVRVPTNMYWLEFQALFSTAESTQVVCAPGDDFALGIVNPPAVPPLASPIMFVKSVNSTPFPICSPAPTQTCPAGPMNLAGTPMQRMTNFAINAVSVIPGQIITLDYQIFDGDDASMDSVLLLDGLRFNPTYHTCPHPLRSGDSAINSSNLWDCH